MPLFELPEYDHVFGEFFFLTVNELMRQKSPLLHRIPNVRVSHLPVSRNSLDDGTVFDNQPFPIETTLTAPFADCVSHNVDVVSAIIDDAAEQAVKVVVPQILGTVGRLSTAAGTALDASGRPLSHDDNGILGSNRNRL